jgi:hypothetical protein
MKDTTGMQDSTGTIAAGDPHAAEVRRVPTWHGWILSILVAVILSVTATLLLGGSGTFRSESAVGPVAGHTGSGTRSGCCPPAAAGK